MPITASAGRLRGKSHGILPKEFAQLRVQLRVRGPQRARPLEERFRRNCEELSRIGCAVSVQQRRRTDSFSVAQRVEFRAHHPRPREVFSVRLERGGAIGIPVLEIELVRELVEDDVLAVGRIGCAAPSRIPRQYKRAQTTARVAEAVFRPFLPDSSADVPHFIGGIASRVNEDRRQLGVVVGLSMKE